MTNDETRNEEVCPLVIRASSLIRYSGFVIRVYSQSVPALAALLAVARHMLITLRRICVFVPRPVLPAGQVHLVPLAARLLVHFHPGAHVTHGVSAAAQVGRVG